VPSCSFERLQLRRIDAYRVADPDVRQLAPLAEFVDRGSAYAKPGRDLPNGKQVVHPARQAAETAMCLHRFTPIGAGIGPKRTEAAD